LGESLRATATKELAKLDASGGGNTGREKKNRNTYVAFVRSAGRLRDGASERKNHAIGVQGTS